MLKIRYIPHIVRSFRLHLWFHNQSVGRDKTCVLSIISPGGFEETGCGVPLKTVVDKAS